MNINDVIAFFHNFDDKNCYKAKKYVFADFVKSNESTIIKNDLKNHLKNDNDTEFYTEIFCEIRKNSNEIKNQDEKNDASQNMRKDDNNEKHTKKLKLANNYYVQYTIKNSPIYIYGLYIKMSRNMSQTPMTINGKLKYKNSVSDFTKYFKTYFQAKEVVFVPAGREDSDVRCFGRPFLLTIEEPQRNLYNYDGIKECECVKEQVINNLCNCNTGCNCNNICSCNSLCNCNNLCHCNNLCICNNLCSCNNLCNCNTGCNCIEETSNSHVKLLNLSIVKKDVKERIFSGETTAMKSYKAYIHTNYNIEKIEPKIYVIKQKTPLRVLHRRANLERTRNIEIKSIERQNDLYGITIHADAGAYIKEFVNGDFGRTVPSLTSLANTYCDCVYLDVLSIETEPLDDDWIIHRIT